MKILLSVIALYSFPLYAQQERECAILLHGLKSFRASISSLERYLRRKNFLAHAPRYNSLTQNIDEIREDIFEKMDGIISNDCKQRIHFVGYSLGGLLIRLYLDQRDFENIGNVVFLGVPNRGSPIVDIIKDKWWFRFIRFVSPPVLDSLSVNSHFLNELESISPYYNFGIIAGNRGRNPYGIDLEEESDGYVPVNSTKLSGMEHVIVIDVSHIGLISKMEVFDHVVYFLNNGSFMAEGPSSPSKAVEK